MSAESHDAVSAAAGEPTAASEALTSRGPVMPRSVATIHTTHRQLEGAGFPVRRPFPVPGLSYLDPFLLIDEMGPQDWAPGEAVGAPDHPHRGFETVTYMLEGEFHHEDSEGNAGHLFAGDVQWMTAGSGVIHSEEPSPRIKRDGGLVHGFQIWVNLPAADKMMAPRYQDVPSADIPTATSEDGAVWVKVIAGESLGVAAVIDTRLPITYLHFRLEAGGEHLQAVGADENTLVYVFGGALEVGVDGDVVEDGQVAFLGPGDEVRLAHVGDEPAQALLLSAEPLHEPVARYGPFVMNTREQIMEAIDDYQSGRFATIQRG